MITLTDATVTYGDNDRPAIDGVSLRIERGDWIAVVGHNGSGKTTLLATIAGLVPLARGVLEKAPAIRTALLMPEPDNQFVAETVRHELTLSVPVDVADDTRRARVSESIDRFALGAMLDRNPHRLSGGEKQRLAAATVWLEDPHVLLLDEPLAYLDDEANHAVVGFVREMNARGVVVVWATPGGDDVALARRVVQLDHGRLVQDGPVSARVDSMTRTFTPPARAARTVTPAENPVVRLEAVTFAYDDVRVLDGIDLNVAAGECLGVTGRNGAGKSTLLLLAGGALTPAAGRVVRLAARGGIAGRALYLPQNPERLFFAETVRDEVAFGLRRAGTSRDDANARVDSALRSVGLEPEEFAERSPFQLSSGEMRRVAFAIAESLAPRLLLMDEPASGLDAAGRDALDALIAARLREGSAVVIASHDRAHLQSTCDRVVRLEAGRAFSTG